jgi:hypothetical protein
MASEIQIVDAETACLLLGSSRSNLCGFIWENKSYLSTIDLSRKPLLLLPWSSFNSNQKKLAVTLARKIWYLSRADLEIYKIGYRGI